MQNRAQFAFDDGTGLSPSCNGREQHDGNSKRALDGADGFSAKPAVLSSWKEIAAHLGKGVRTVQRWEREYSLPVRRPKSKGIVIAHPDELTAWLQHANSAAMDAPSQTDGTQELLQPAFELAAACAQLKAENGRLRRENALLRARVQSLKAASLAQNSPPALPPDSPKQRPTTLRSIRA